MKQDLEVETLQMQLPYYELARKRGRMVQIDLTCSVVHDRPSYQIETKLKRVGLGS